jgi:glucokinase
MLIGVDVGGTNLRVGVIDGVQVIDEQRFHADFSGLCRNRDPAAALQSLLEVLTEALSNTLARYPTVSAVGLGFPGFIVDGRVAQSPNLPGLNDVDLATPLSKRLGRQVVIENDALAAAYGEYRLHGQQSGGLIYLGLGTGVGGGLILDSQPFPGEHGVAMEVGHLIVVPGGRLCGCGNHGCMEQYASATGVAATYGELAGKTLTAHQIVQAAESGDSHAMEAYRLAGEKLAQALAHVLKIVDVGYVVIGGGMSAAWPWMADAFQLQLDQDLIPALRGRVEYTLSSAGDRAGMIGAALLAENSPHF